MVNVKIIADSTCDLPKEYIKKHDIDIIPLYVTLGEDTLKDGVEIQTKDLFNYVETSKTLPKTAAASVMDFIETFKPYAKAGRSIVFIGISSEFSAMMQNANLARQEFDGADIRLIDSRNLSSGIGLLVLEAAELAEAGKTAEEIEKHLDSLIPKVRSSFIIDTMTYLYRGGRCNAIQAISASALKIKPEIIVQDGRMHPSEKYHGNIIRSARKYAEFVLEDLNAIEPKRVFITYSPSDENLVKAVREVIENKNYFGEIIQSDAGCVISSHCGPNTIGVLYIVK